MNKIYKHRITPFLVVGLILMLISVFAFIFAAFNEFAGRGSKGTTTVVIIAILVLLITGLVIFIEGKILTKENKRQVIICETVVIVVVLIRLYSLGYSY